MPSAALHCPCSPSMRPPAPSGRGMRPPPASARPPHAVRALFGPSAISMRHPPPLHALIALPAPSAASMRPPHAVRRLHVPNGAGHTIYALSLPHAPLRRAARPCRAINDAARAFHACALLLNACAPPSCVLAPTPSLSRAATAHSGAFAALSRCVAPRRARSCRVASVRAISRTLAPLPAPAHRLASVGLFSHPHASVSRPRVPYPAWAPRIPPPACAFSPPLAPSRSRSRRIAAAHARVAPVHAVSLRVPSPARGPILAPASALATPSRAFATTHDNPATPFRAVATVSRRAGLCFEPRHAL
ncbi:hypothetical protein DENSPDRAFT_886673, partial [Dentipellis sp. KUC8613]